MSESPFLYLEENYQELIKTLEKLGISYEIKPSNQKSPQQKEMYELYVEEKSKKEVFHLAMTCSHQCNMMFYTPNYIRKENKVPISKKDLLHTTFLYKMLIRPDLFLERDNWNERNVLDEFEVRKAPEANNFTGYYKTHVQSKARAFSHGNDEGILSLKVDKQDKLVTLTSTIQNIRRSQELLSDETPYDVLFGFSKQNGVTTTRLKEYYRFENSHVLHYAEGLDYIELYCFVENQMECIPTQVFIKKTASSEIKEKNGVELIKFAKRVRTLSLNESTKEV